MRLPSTYINLIHEPDKIEPVTDYALVYPPVGFLPWSIGGIGNGDEFGYYWPIGREASDPIVAMMSHDCWALIPVASSIEGLSRTGGCSEITALLNGTSDSVDDEEVDDETEGLGIAERLALDLQSPHLLVANADAEAAGNDLDRAESLYLQAIDVLPEYTAAHFGLAMVYRRQRKSDSAIRWMLEAIRSPLCFQGASFWSDSALPALSRNDFRRKCLMWLQKARPEEIGPVAADPLFQVRDRLTFATGVKTIDDFSLYDQVIEEYVARGQVLDAIRLLMLVGELMNCETVSFRERFDFTLPKFRERLLRLFRIGPAGRAEFLQTT